MAATIWSGSMSFGLVNIPIKVVPAVHEKGVSFHMLHKDDNVRLQTKRVCPQDGAEVPWSDVVKGYEVAKDEYVVVTKEELEALAPEKSKTMEITDFVDLKEIDPAYFAASYYLVPTEAAKKPYTLLFKAMRDANKVGIAKVVMRQKEYLVAIRPKEDALVMEMMHYHDEIDPSKEVVGKTLVPEKELDKRLVDMAEKLIESLSGDFQPEKYTDEYRQSVLDLIEKKAAGKTITMPAKAKAPPKTKDLMAALEASLAEAKRRVGPAKGKAAKHAKGRGGGEVEAEA